MAPLPDVELIPLKRHDTAWPHYDVYAGGEQLVGVIHRQIPSAATEVWFWSINTIMVDASVGQPMKGYVRSFTDAKADFRTAFDAWLAWAMAMPKWDLKRAEIDKNLKAIGVR